MLPKHFTIIPRLVFRTNNQAVSPEIPELFQQLLELINKLNLFVDGRLIEERKDQVIYQERLARIRMTM